MQKSVESVLPTLFKFFLLPSVNLFIQSSLYTYQYNDETLISILISTKFLYCMSGDL